MVVAKSKAQRFGKVGIHSMKIMVKPSAATDGAVFLWLCFRRIDLEI